jgi:hypothetical protein
MYFLRRVPVKTEMRRSFFVLYDFHLPPSDFPNAAAQRLGRRLFGRKANGERFRSPAALLSFGFREKSLQQALTMALQGGGKPLHRNQVNAAAQVHVLISRCAIRGV